ncbi:MAG: hypothetical protein R3301_14715, partial [Saprospiraceae bacterium]|nr:hypothetical protein [Saprospiraceae bacterium]
MLRFPVFRFFGSSVFRFFGFRLVGPASVSRKERQGFTQKDAERHHSDAVLRFIRFSVAPFCGFSVLRFFGFRLVCLASVSRKERH